MLEHKQNSSHTFQPFDVAQQMAQAKLKEEGAKKYNYENKFKDERDTVFSDSGSFYAKDDKHAETIRMELASKYENFLKGPLEERTFGFKYENDLKLWQHLFYPVFMVKDPAIKKLLTTWRTGPLKPGLIAKPLYNNMKTLFSKDEGDINLFKPDVTQKINELSVEKLKKIKKQSILRGIIFYLLTTFSACLISYNIVFESELQITLASFVMFVVLLFPSVVTTIEYLKVFDKLKEQESE